MSDEARELANKVESLNIKSTSGDIDAVKKSVTDELNAMPLKHRANVAHEMETMINSDHTNNQTLPSVSIDFSKDGQGQEHVEDMKVKIDSKGTGWFGMDEHKTAEIYDNQGRPSWLPANMVSQAIDTDLTTVNTIGKQDDN